MSLRTAPPPEFPLYGLDGPDITRRALDWVQVYVRDGRSTTYGIWLVHLTAAGGGTRIGNLDPAVLAAMDGGPAGAAAHHAASALADLTLPGAAPTIGPVVARHLQARTPPNRYWDEAGWTVDRTEVVAHTLSFADGWAGVADLGHTYLCAVGTGQAPSTLDLRRLATTSPYGFDHEAPIDRMHHRDEHRVWPESLLTPPNTDLHDDHRRLLDQRD